MTEQDDVKRFLEHLQEPVDIASPAYYTAEEVKGLEKYQDMAKELFSDLKADNCIQFAEFFPQFETAMAKATMEDARVVKFTRITINLAIKLKDSKELVAEEQWFILLSLYVWECEQIKRIFSQIVHRVNDALGERRLKLRNSVTLGPFLDIMNRYKNGKYHDLFSEIDVDLRNAFVHSSFDFPNDEILYDGKNISALDFLLKYRKVTALFAILFSSRAKSFATEFKDLAVSSGIKV